MRSRQAAAQPARQWLDEEYTCVLSRTPSSCAPNRVHQSTAQRSTNSLLLINDPPSRAVGKRQAVAAAERGEEVERRGRAASARALPVRQLARIGGSAVAPRRALARRKNWAPSSHLYYLGAPRLQLQQPAGHDESHPPAQRCAPFCPPNGRGAHGADPCCPPSSPSPPVPVPPPHRCLHYAPCSWRSRARLSLPACARRICLSSATVARPVLADEPPGGELRATDARVRLFPARLLRPCSVLHALHDRARHRPAFTPQGDAANAMLAEKREGGSSSAPPGVRPLTSASTAAAADGALDAQHAAACAACSAPVFALLAQTRALPAACRSARLPGQFGAGLGPAHAPRGGASAPHDPPGRGVPD